MHQEQEEIKAMRRPVVVGIGGCSGSGKTSLARELERTEASVRAQFEATARPMAERYVLPSQARAAMTVSGTEAMDWSIEQVLRGLRDRGLSR